MQLSPRGTWLMYRVTDNAPITEAGLAQLLGVASSDLEQRPASGVQGDSAQAGASVASVRVALTPAGQQAAGRLRAARQAGIDRLCTEWQPDQVPELRRLIGRVTTTLVATDTAPEHDAAGAPAAPSR